MIKKLTLVLALATGTASANTSPTTAEIARMDGDADYVSHIRLCALLAARNGDSMRNKFARSIEAEYQTKYSNEPYFNAKLTEDLDTRMSALDTERRINAYWKGCKGGLDQLLYNSVNG
ncbi:hypothetical protein JCM19236_5655 [Vibrio sp. JCM 19236]|nr:hypothetical protein JCM19236_5655 [Vibrio sp. JCM 19236]